MRKSKLVEGVDYYVYYCGIALLGFPIIVYHFVKNNHGHTRTS